MTFAVAEWNGFGIWEGAGARNGGEGGGQVGIKRREVRVVGNDRILLRIEGPSNIASETYPSILRPGKLNQPYQSEALRGAYMPAERSRRYKPLIPELQRNQLPDPARRTSNLLLLDFDLQYKLLNWVLSSTVDNIPAEFEPYDYYNWINK